MKMKEFINKSRKAKKMRIKIRLFSKTELSAEKEEKSEM